MKELVILLRNIKGQLGDAARMLADKGFNIQAFTVAEAGQYGVVRLILENPHESTAKAADALRSRFRARVTEVLALRLPNEPGTLASLGSLFGEAGVNIEYAYQSLSRSPDEVVVLVKVDNHELARQVVSRTSFMDEVSNF